MRSPSLLRLLFTQLLLVLTTGGVLPTQDLNYSVKEVAFVPRGWIQHSRPAPEHKIQLKIALPQSNFNELERQLYEVSNPDHERYGQHLSKEEVEELIAPRSASINAVNTWLLSWGFTDDELKRSPAGDWVSIRVSVGKVEDMLKTKYHVWKHIENGDYLVRTTSYSLPEDLHQHIELIQPTTMFGRFKPEKSSIFSVVPAPPSFAGFQDVDTTMIKTDSGASVDASCNSTITITCLQQLYNAVGFTPTAKNNSIGITGYLGENANIQDLQTFFAAERPDAVNSTFEIVLVTGGQDNQSPAAAGGEANLDTQFAFGISHPVPRTFYTTAGMPPFIPEQSDSVDTNEPYANWLDFVLSHPNPPLAISTSYGDDEQTVPFSYARRVCAGFAQLGARGVSLMFSSGDGGVGDGDSNPVTQQCFTNDGHNETKFMPGFPASCPFVTAVGGTTHIPEVAVSRFFSGGGFSNYFSRPRFQDEGVSLYLNTLPNGTYAGLFNPNGRAIPDVAAQADLFKVFVGGEAFLIGGTSASSPAFTGFVALLNDVRLKAGRSPLGFLNPFLYSKGLRGLNDITIGHNSGCGTRGFNASKGWDPVTGLGTPDFAKLRELVLLES